MGIVQIRLKLAATALAAILALFCLAFGIDTISPVASSIASAETVQGTTYFVSPSGSDANSGTKDRPWATPGYASKQLRAGDTLIIAAGTYPMSRYYDDMIMFDDNGREGAWITIRGESAENRPVLLGRDGVMSAVDLGGKSYIRLENLEITSDLAEPYSGGFEEGIDAGGSAGGPPCDHIELRNIYIHHVEQTAINCAGNFTDSTIDGCTITMTGGWGIGAPGADGGRGWENVVIRNTTVSYAGYFSQGKEQPSEWDRPDGIGMEDSEGPLEISHCTFEHNRGDGVDSKSKRTYVHHTVIANNRCDSLKLWGGGTRIENVLIYGDGDGDPDNGPWASIVVGTEDPGSFEFINVTVDDNETRGNYPIYMQYDSTSAPIDVLFRNCIVAHGYSTIYFGAAATPTFDHCLLYRNGDPSLPVVEWNGREYLPSQVSELGTGNISADPMFVLRAWGTDGDYHLAPTSPAIDAGSADDAPADDIEGKGRPLGAGVDIGAYEG